MRISTRFKLAFTLLLTCVISSSVYAQEKTVSGKVTAAGEGELPGVNVLVKGTTTGTVTDLEGNYRVTVPEGYDVLVFSSIGYTNQEVTIGNQTTIDIVLEEDIQSLSEVVVVGYGTQEKKEITSAVTSIKAEDFNGGLVNNPAQLIQGKVAGLVVARPGANPNEGFNIRLRGLSSVGANTQPLIVVDGVIGGSLDNIDPNDIESIDILKDGSAAAIYGTRGSAGVILVTTKSGKAGRMQVDYNGSFSVESVAKSVPVLDAEQFRNFGGGTDLGSSTDWFEETTQNALAQVHNLSLSGGTEQTTYRLSVNYRDADGVAVTTGFDQLNARLNLTQMALKDKLTLTAQLSTTTREADLGFSDAFRYATVYNPTAPVRSNDDEFDIYDGYFQQVLFDYYNPLAILEQNINEEKKKIYNANFRAEYEFLPGLRGALFYATQTENKLRGIYFDKNSFWIGRDRNGIGGRSTEENFNELFEATVNYNTAVGQLDVAALGGYSIQDFENEGFFAAGGDYLVDEFTYNNLGAALDFPNGRGNAQSFKDANRLIGFFGRVNLNYAGTYFLSASVRQEGSSRFGTDNKWGTFPAVSGGLTLTNLVDIPGVDNLKLRASWGVTGNIPGSSYLSIPRVGPTGNFLVDGSFVPSYGPVSNANPLLKWERKGEWDVGFDFSALDDRLTGSFDYYERTTRDLLLEFAVPVPPNLFSTQWVNIGELTNKGVEFTLNYRVIQNANFSWETGGNFSSFNTELVSLSNDDFEFGSEQFIAGMGSPGQNGTFLIRVKEGEPVGQIWGPKYESIDEDGKWVYQDLDGDGDIDKDDETVIGNGLPDFTYGWNNTFTFGNFDFNFFLRGSVGHDLVNSFRGFYEAPSNITSYNILESAEDFKNLKDAPKFSSLYVENASFLKLDNATLGYRITLPEEGIFRNLRFYVSGQNLFVITDYSGVDPEVRFSDKPENEGDINGALDAVEDDGNPLAPGIDRRNTWFRTRTFTLGVNLGF